MRIDDYSTVNGTRRDRAAARAAPSEDRSNGQTDVKVPRLTLLKRQMYGRTSFDLLRKQVLRAA